MKINRKVGGMLAVLVLVLAGAGIAVFGFGVGRGKDTLVLYGNVDIREVSLGFRVSGRLKSLAFDEGDAVRTGAVMAQLDPEPFQHALHQAEANVSAAEAHARLMHAGYQPQEVAQAAATLNERKAALADAQAVLQRQAALRGTGATSEKAYDDALAARDQASALVDAAAQQFDLYRRGYRKEDQDQADAQLAQARAQREASRLQVSDTVLRAPSEGVVLTRAVEPGTILAVGAPVFTVSLTRPVWVRAYVDEPHLGSVAPGTPVWVTTDSRPDKPYAGVVGYVSPSAEFTPKNVETTDLRTDLVYRLRVVVTHPDEGLRQGMPVTVRVAQRSD